MTWYLRPIGFPPWSTAAVVPPTFARLAWVVHWPSCGAAVAMAPVRDCAHNGPKFRAPPPGKPSTRAGAMDKPNLADVSPLHVAGASRELVGRRAEVEWLLERLDEAV